MWIMEEKTSSSHIKGKCEERINCRNEMEIGLCKLFFLSSPFLLSMEGIAMQGEWFEEQTLQAE
jgi:hypothetical protein